MTVFYGFPQDGHAFSADEVGRALAGLVRRGSGGPVAGMLAVGPDLSAVPASWKVEVGTFTYVDVVSGAIILSGLSAAEQVDITSATSIPAGQARIDLICWDTSTPELTVVEGVAGTSPTVPSAGGLVPVAQVRVNSGDGMVVGSRVTAAYELTGLAGGGVDKGTVAKRNVARGDLAEVNVSFPAGMFDAAPNVQATLWGSGRGCTVQVDNVTSSGCMVRLINTSTDAGSKSIGAFWRAEAV